DERPNDAACKSTSGTDIPNEMGNTSVSSDDDGSIYRELQDSVDLQPSISGTDPGISTMWEMNYHEAAIYLEEGENNDKFNSHPKDRASLPAYLVTHNHWFYSMDLAASLLLMALAIIEKPEVSIFK
ncbi:unnamed protein product, partial [Meganyctiphanes norvegica]